MKTITYKFADGTESTVEVSDEFYSLYKDMEKADGLSDRKQYRRTQSLEKSVDNGWDVEDPNADVVKIFEENERNRKLHEAISTLTPAQQSLVRKVFFDRIPQQEIALQEGVTRYAINKRLARILRKLEKVLS